MITYGQLENSMPLVTTRQCRHRKWQWHYLW